MVDLPYVVSGDIRLLLNKWCRRHGFTMPDVSFFRTLRKEFHAIMEDIFNNYSYVTEEELFHGLRILMRRGGLPTISLDVVYSGSKYSMSVTRTVNIDGDDTGVGPRPGAPSIEQQINEIVELGFTAVALADDVVFTGECINNVCAMLEKRGISVPVVYAGIAVGKGARAIMEKDRRVECVHWYEQVIDEVCERDFFLGVPLSGRTIGGDGNTCIPYLLPYGNPGKWATIPELHQEIFSARCFQLTAELWREIERVSNRTVHCCDLDRKVIGIPWNETRFVDILENYPLLCQCDRF